MPDTSPPSHHDQTGLRERLRRAEEWLRETHLGNDFVLIYGITFLVGIVTIIVCFIISAMGHTWPLPVIKITLLALTGALTIGVFMRILTLSGHDHEMDSQKARDETDLHLLVQATELVLCIFLSFGFIGLLRYPSSPEPTELLAFFLESLFPAFFIGIVIFSFKQYNSAVAGMFQVRAHIRTKMKEFDDLLRDHINESKDKLRDEMDKLGKEMLNLGEIESDLRGEADAIKEAHDDTRWIVSLAIDSLMQAHDTPPSLNKKRGNDLMHDVIGGGLDHTLAARIAANIEKGSKEADTAWLAFFQTYSQEEIFDLSHYDVVTNVRNYAFTIINLIAQMSLLLKEQDNKQLVVLNSSPFNPKDFYNWPDRRAPRQNSRARYHEAEFFGIYRRMFARLLDSHQGKIIPLRIIHAADSMSENRRGSFSVNVGLGWRVDPKEKMCWDMARHCIFPSSKISDEREDPPSLHTPLYSSAEPLATETGTPHIDDFYDWTKAAREYARAYGTNFVSPNFTDYHKHTKENEKTLGEYESKRWKVIEFIKEDLTSYKRYAKAKGARIRAPQFGGSAFHYVTGICGRLHDRIVEMETIRDTVEEKDECDINSSELIEVVRLIQGADADLSYLRLADKHVLGNKNLFKKSQKSVTESYHNEDIIGNRRGLFEEWLFYFLCKMTPRHRKNRLGGNGPIPLWLAFGTDFLGIDPSLARLHDPETGGLNNYEEEMTARCRIILHKNLNNGPPTKNLQEREPGKDTPAEGERVEQRHNTDDEIGGEYMMIGLKNKNDEDLLNIKWHVLLKATISEPYQTCRLQFIPNMRAGGSRRKKSINSDGPQAQFAKYEEKVREYLKTDSVHWKNTEACMKGLFKQVAAIKKADPLYSTLLKPDAEQTTQAELA